MSFIPNQTSLGVDTVLREVLSCRRNKEAIRLRCSVLHVGRSLGQQSFVSRAQQLPVRVRLSAGQPRPLQYGGHVDASQAEAVNVASVYVLCG
ncbi:unnamed protein product [Boreogadus saida]